MSTSRKMMKFVSAGVQMEGVQRDHPPMGQPIVDLGDDRSVPTGTKKLKAALARSKRRKKNYRAVQRRLVRKITGRTASGSRPTPLGVWFGFVKLVLCQTMTTFSYGVDSIRAVSRDLLVRGGTLCGELFVVGKPMDDHGRSGVATVGSFAWRPFTAVVTSLNTLSWFYRDYRVVYEFSVPFSAFLKGAYHTGGGEDVLTGFSGFKPKRLRIRLYSVEAWKGKSNRYHVTFTEAPLPEYDPNGSVQFIQSDEAEWHLPLVKFKWTSWQSRRLNFRVIAMLKGIDDDRKFSEPVCTCNLRLEVRVKPGDKPIVIGDVIQKNMPTSGTFGVSAPVKVVQPPTRKRLMQGPSPEPSVSGEA